MHLDIFTWLEAANPFLVDHISKDNFSGTFVSDSPVPVVDGGNELIQKMEEATRCTIIILDLCLNGMVARANLTRSLTVQMKRSISGTCSFFDAQFRFMPRAVISLRSG